MTTIECESNLFDLYLDLKYLNQYPYSKNVWKSVTFVLDSKCVVSTDL